MTDIDICNTALALIGQSRSIESMDEVSPEAEACKMFYKQSLDLCLDSNNWGFARRDEVITNEDLLEDVVVLPYLHAYKLPEDVMRVLYLTKLKATPDIEAMGKRRAIQFNFRNYDGKKVLATDQEPSFAIHYQAFIDDISVCSPAFYDALSYMLASKLASALIRGSDGVTISSNILKLGMSKLTLAAAYDAQQGGYSVEDKKFSSFMRARRGV